MYPCGDTRFARSSVSASANAVTKTTGTASSARSRSAAAMPSAPSRSAMSMRTRSGRTAAAWARALAYESAVPTTWYPRRRNRPSMSSATTASSSTTRMRAASWGPRAQRCATAACGLSTTGKVSVNRVPASPSIDEAPPSCARAPRSASVRATRDAPGHSAAQAARCRRPPRRGSRSRPRSGTRR